MNVSPRSDITGYVLAGGQSTRMGQDKALLPVQGEPLIAHAVRRLREVCTGVAILSGPTNPERDALLFCHARLVPDRDTEFAGPLAGVAAALADCPQPYALLLAVDQPAIPARALHNLVSASVSGAPAAHLMNGDRAEPIPLLASRDLLPMIQAALRDGERRLLPTVCASAAHFGRGLQAITPPNLAEAEGWFRNLNTPEDLRDWLEPGKASNQSGPTASE